MDEKKPRKKPRASLNKAGAVEKPPQVMPPRPDQLYAIPGQLKQMVVEALQNSAPRQLSVGQVNGICNALSQLRSISGELSEAAQVKAELDRLKKEKQSA